MSDLTIYDRFENPGPLIQQLGKAIFQSQMFGAETSPRARFWRWSARRGKARR